MTKRTLLLIFGFIYSLGQAQDLYDTSIVQEIRITFAESNWDELLDAQKEGDGDYTEAESISINGEVFNSIGVKYKGNSSYDANQIKNPFHIELDTYVDQDYGGYTDIKLANVIFDPTFVRETVAYNIVSKYMHAPQANYANVYVNDVLIGLYTNTESISKKFVNTHFNSKTNAFFNCSPPAGASPQGNDFPSLEYLGTNSASYEDAYELESDEGWEDLIELTDILNNDFDNIETVLNVDSALWMLAFHNVMVNLDSYIGQFKQNYYLYKDDNGQFNPVIWDVNMSFGTFSGTGTINLRNTNDKSELTPFLHEDDDEWPLMKQLMSNESYRKKYLAHYYTILEENISNQDYFTTAQTYQELIEEDVYADTNKFYTDAQFISNLTTDATVGNNTACGLSNLMDARSTYLTNLDYFTATKPSITSIASIPETPVFGESATITAQINDTNSDAVYLGYRDNLQNIFTKVQMYDDGVHNDGSANDNIYGTSIDITNTSLQYYIYAENNDIGAFSPARAEYEFYTINATYETIEIGDLVVNELMASNDVTAADQDGEYDDWIELYNNSLETISLDNLYLSDDEDELLMWQFPNDITIGANEYLIVWCDGDTDQEGLHADLKLSTGGENIILSYDNGTIIENISFGEQTTDISYARNPNGTGDFVLQNPTYNANNEENTLNIDSFYSTDNTGNFTFLAYPNPTLDKLIISSNLNVNIEKISIHDIAGKTVYNEEYKNINEIELSFLNFRPGMYLLKVNEATAIKIVKQ